MWESGLDIRKHITQLNFELGSNLESKARGHEGVFRPQVCWSIAPNLNKRSMVGLKTHSLCCGLEWCYG